MERDELAAWLRLTLTPGVGNSAARRLLAAWGPPQNIFAHGESAWQTHVGEKKARALAAPPPGLPELLERTWQWLQAGRAPGEGHDGHAVITLGDAAYPPALLNTADPPLLLYLQGAPRFVHAAEGAAQGAFAPPHCLAMVGSRSPTAQGAEHARQFARALRGAGLCIISGLALGIDAAAHEGALQDVQDEHNAQDGDAAQPATIAVVGTGLDQVYPQAHRELARRIARHGLLVSEFPLGTPPLPGNFPKRNRIISGLAQGTLVVEAALASGSLITARLAAEQGREVFAIPGSIHAPQSRGCHALLRQGAKLVETAQDVLEELRLPAPPLTPLTPPARDNARGNPPPRRSEDEDAVLRALGFDPMGLDTLLARTGMDAATLQVRLLELELAGRVARLPGGLFQRVERA